MESKTTSMLWAYTSSIEVQEESWYFDNGCSGHMTGDKDCMISIKPCKTQNVTFEDEAKGRIMGK